jgi:hypothetical protein
MTRKRSENPKQVIADTCQTVAITRIGKKVSHKDVQPRFTQQFDRVEHSLPFLFAMQTTLLLKKALNLSAFKPST